MQIDIAILIIVAIFTILGFKNGFAYTVFFMLGWIISFVVAFFTRDIVREFLMDSTPVYDWYHGHIYDISMKFITGYTDTFTGGLPGAFGGAVEAASEKIAQDAAEQITSASFGVFCFIGTALVVKLVLFLITLAVSRKYHGGFVGALDATGGLLVGVAQGFIVVFVVLILILPVSLALGHDAFAAVSGALDTSFFSKTLFTVNPLIPLVDGFAPGLFAPDEWLDKIKGVTEMDIPSL
ncbi:MAG: CvpA family protein [Clostridiales Family XIII bacterium]|nr:CvpA family protein [Clostridiales Family XIII bacterium]